MSEAQNNETPEAILAMHLSTCKGLLWDCDGTLLDTMPIYHKSWVLTLAEHDLPPLPEARFYSFGGMTVGKIFSVLCEESGKFPIEECQEGGDIVKMLEETKRKHHKALVDKGEGHAAEIIVAGD